MPLDTLTVKEAADLLGVSPKTVHRWLTDKLLPGFQYVPRGNWRIRRSDVEALVPQEQTA